MRKSSVWRVVGRGLFRTTPAFVLGRRRRTSSSATPPSAATTEAARTACAATFPKPRPATDGHVNSRWTTPSGPRGSEPNRGRVYRSRSATPGLDRLSTVRRVVSDVGAIVAVLCALTLMAVAVWWLWRLT